MNKVPWGFGDAPFKKETYLEYAHALSVVQDFLNKQLIEEDLPESISIVKGMLNRILREDRWDWHTVDLYFGEPDHDEVHYIVKKLVELRKAVLNNDKNKMDSLNGILRNTQLLHCIRSFFIYHKNRNKNKVSKPVQESVPPTIEDSKLNKEDTSKTAVEHNKSESEPTKMSMEKHERIQSKKTRPDKPKHKKKKGKSLFSHAKPINAFIKDEPKEPVKNAKPKTETIWIYKGKTPCNIHKGDAVQLRAEVTSVRDGKEYPINVFYCPKCKKFYINVESFNAYAKRYGIPMVNLEYSYSGVNSGFGNFKEESLLHFLGYNVNASENLTQTQRRKILSEAIDAKIVTKQGIIRFLERLIARNKNRENFTDAVYKWRTDLVFVSNYKILDQKEVIGVFKIYNSNIQK